MLMSKMYTGEDVTTAMIQMYLLTTEITLLSLGMETVMLMTKIYTGEDVTTAMIQMHSLTTAIMLLLWQMMMMMMTKVTVIMLCIDL